MRVSPSPVISGSLLVLLLLGASLEASASTEGPLSLGVTGSTPSDPPRNPVAVLWPADVQRLMLKIARRPYSRQEIESAMGSRVFSIDDARAVGLLREEDGLFHIDFNLLTVADQQRILEVFSDLGRELATVFLEQRAEFEALAAGHRSGRITTHYSGAELSKLIEATDRVCERGPGARPELVVLRRLSVS